jgi:hypothetical protein
MHSSGSGTRLCRQQEPGDQLSCQILSPLALGGGTHVCATDSLGGNIIGNTGAVALAEALTRDTTVCPIM